MAPSGCVENREMLRASPIESIWALSLNGFMAQESYTNVIHVYLTGEIIRVLNIMHYFHRSSNVQDGFF